MYLVLHKFLHSSRDLCKWQFRSESQSIPTDTGIHPCPHTYHHSCTQWNRLVLHRCPLCSHQRNHRCLVQHNCHHSYMVPCKLPHYMSSLCNHLHKNTCLGMCKFPHLSKQGCKLEKSMRSLCSVGHICKCAVYYMCHHSDMEGHIRPSHRALLCILLCSCKCQVLRKHHCFHTTCCRLGLHMLSLCSREGIHTCSG